MTETENLAGEIRNIQQSVQYRDVVKQASDIVVYIDGQDYLINPYLGESGVTVPLNDFVNSWTSTYDVDSMVPSGSLNLTVPVELDHLFRAPGGNNILKTMSEIRVFAKGYFFAPNTNNTLYHQIFKGFISSVGYNPSGKLTTISINCFGALGMLERMQVEQAPSIMSSSPQEFTPFTSTNWNLDPYQSIAFVFIYSSMIDGFEQYSIPQAAMNTSNPYYQAVESQYVAKWQALLYDLARDVHVYGSPSVTDVIGSIRATLKPNDAATNSYAKEALGQFGDVRGAATEVAQRTSQNDFYAALRGYMPDMGIGSIQLLNGRLTTRLERLRYMANLIGFEAYQDVDGGIVVKPPLYNLDVLNVDNNGADTPSALANLTAANNPFVVQLSEVLSESESEDEAAVRLTRVTARGSRSPSFQWEASKELLSTAEDIDVAKLSQFGLRTEAPKEAHWFTDGDGKALYAYAASELARANRGYRTYNIVIPLRPELKLGFPMYLPHKDIYGYIKSITMSWNKGSSATTSVVLDTLRRRPLLPQQQSVTDTSSGTARQVILMTPQNNLVQQWTSAETATTATTQNPIVQPGQLASLPLPQQLVVQQQVQMMNARRTSGSDYGVNPDSAVNCWRIQLDVNHKFDKVRVLDDTYYEDLRSVRPYTDNKGYEVVGPFPWGRWKSLKDALNTFTIADALGSTGTSSPVINPVSAETATVSNAAAFLFTGDSPAATVESTSTLLSAMVTQAGLINNYKVFELSYGPETATSASGTTVPSTGSATSAIGSTLSAMSNTNTTAPTDDELAASRAATMMSSQAASESLVSSILRTVPPEPTIVVTSTKTAKTASNSTATTASTLSPAFGE